MLQPPLEGLDKDSVTNVYLFLADALRYDELPEEVARRGVSFETVAHATATPQCLPTIVSGQLPPKHGVTWFNHVMRDSIHTIFDIDGFNAGYSEVLWERTLRDVLGNPGEADVESIEEPFVVFEHDNGGHAPYPELDYGDPASMLRQMESREELVEHYRRTVSGSSRRFRDRLRLLERRGVLDDTLVIFMSDHGQLLGERGGFFGHGLPLTPEVVFVPTVFIHPSLEEGKRGDHLAQQADVYPTIVDVLTGRSPPSDGENLTEEVEEDRPAYSQGILHPPRKFRDTFLDPGYDARGVWTRDGGHVFVRNSRLVRVVTACYEATMSGNTGAYNSHRSVVRTLRMALSHYLRNYHRYGEPAIRKDEAHEMIENITRQTGRARERELSAETKEHLSDLGYH